MAGIVTSTMQTQVAELYVGFFGRAPLAEGMGYWSQLLADGATPQQLLADKIQYTQEYRDLYAGFTPEEQVKTFFQHVFGRDPQPTGLAYWASKVTATNPFYNVAWEMVSGVYAGGPNYDPADTALVRNKVEVSKFYSIDLRGTDKTVADQAFVGVTQDKATVVAKEAWMTQAAGTYTLTTGIDIATAATFDGSLTSQIFDGRGPTLNAYDQLTGLLPTGNTLNLVDAYGSGTDIMPSGVKLTNIQNINLNTAGNAGQGMLQDWGNTFDTSTFASVTATNVVSAGGSYDYVQASNNSTINVTHNNVGGGVETFGGSNVAVTTKGNGGVYVAGFDAGSSQSFPSGTVTVNANGYLNGSANVDVEGGTDVTVNVAQKTATGDITIGNVGGDALTTGANPTGAINVTSNSVAYLNSAEKLIASNGVGYGYVQDGESFYVYTNKGKTNGYTALWNNDDVIFGGTTVNVNVKGDEVVVGDPDAPLDQASNLATGAVTVSNIQTKTYDNRTGVGHGAVMGGKVIVAGGSSVTVTTNTGGGVIVGADLESADQNALINTDGAVVVVDTSTDSNGAFGIGTYANGPQTSVFGGSTVNVTEAGGNVYVGGYHKNTTTTGSVTVTETRDSNQEVEINGGNGITVNAKGQTVIAGDAVDAGGSAVAGAVLVNQNSVYSGQALGSSNAISSVTVNGGTTVTINTTGGDVNVGSETLKNGLPTGAVNITNTFSGAGGANDGVVEVLGGTTVNINVANTTDGDIHVGHTDAKFNAAGTALVNAAAFASGNVTIDNAVTFGDTTYYGDSDVIVRTNGAQTVAIAGATAVEVTDVNVKLAPATGKAVGTSALATVNLTGILGNATLTSDALTAVSVSDSFTNVEVKNATAHAQALTVNDSLVDLTDASATAISITETGESGIDLTTVKATTLSINNAGTTVLDITAPGLTTITANGSGTLFVASDLSSKDAVTGFASLKSFDASQATGNVVVDLRVDRTTFQGGSGDDYVIADVTTGLNGQASRVNGGGGNNTVVLTAAQELYNSVLTPNGPISADFTNFQNLGFSNGAKGRYDVSGFNNLFVGSTDNVIPVIVPNDLTLENAGANTTLTFVNVADPFDTAKVIYSQKTDTAADALTVNLGLAAPESFGMLENGVDADLTIKKIETLTVNSTGNAAGGFVPKFENTINVTDVAVGTKGAEIGTVKTLNVTGNSDVAVTESVLGAFDGSSTINKIVVTNTGATDVTGVATSAKGITITGGAGMLTANLTSVAGAVDSLTSGSGGVDVQLGAGGATGLNKAASGSQTLNLAASTAVRDTINVQDTVGGVANLGTNAVLNSFKLGDAGKNSDQLSYANDKIILANGSYTTAGLNAGNEYTSSNGVLTLVTPGVTLLKQLQDAKEIVSTAGANTITAITFGGSTYVVTASNSATIDEASVMQLTGDTGVTGFGSASVSGLAGGAGGTVMVESFNNDLLNGSFKNVTDKTNTGSAVADKTYTETGYTVVGMENHAKGFTTTYNGLASWGVVGVGADTFGANSKGGNLVVNQTGASQYLTLGAKDGDASLNTVTFNGAALNVNADRGALSIDSLVNSSNTSSTISISNFAPLVRGNKVTIKSITDTALTTIDASKSGGDLVLGDAKSALSQAGLTVLGGYGDLHVTLSGANDVVTSAKDTTGNYTVVSSGANATISVGDADNEVTIRGANSTVNLGANLTSDFFDVTDGLLATLVTGDQTVHTTSVGATITFVTSTVDGDGSQFGEVYVDVDTRNVIDGGMVNGSHQGIAANTTINMADFAGALVENPELPNPNPNAPAPQDVLAPGMTVEIYTAGVLTGTTSTGAYATTTLNNVQADASLVVPYEYGGQPTFHLPQATISLVLDNLKSDGLTQLNEVLAGGSMAASQVNVASATTLAQALDLAAAVASQSQGADGKIAAGTGIVNWFQFGGNTYIVETINAGTTAAAQTALDANDAVITLTGLVDLTNAYYVDGTGATVDAVVILTTGIEHAIA